MPMLEVSINGRPYNVQCGEGEEVRLKRLAQYVDARVRELSGGQGQIGDAKLLVLASLLIADELDDALAEIKRLHGRDPVDNEAVELEQSRAIERIAERLEQLAVTLETT
ncbi:MAG: cell division protein ZapA [Geminicoccaceae bacterium]|nr:cell division protein ZapA [Geminicoccaceae bacterium]MCB9944930.1 cell division protein ZapA [Geminicoccaceae bacterium]